VGRWYRTHDGRPRGRQERVASVRNAYPSCWSAPKGLSMARRPAVGAGSGIGPTPGHGRDGAAEVRKVSLAGRRSWGFSCRVSGLLERSLCGQASYVAPNHLFPAIQGRGSVPTPHKTKVSRFAEAPSISSPRRFNAELSPNPDAPTVPFTVFLASFGSTSAGPCRSSLSATTRRNRGAAVVMWPPDEGSNWKARGQTFDAT
jgi:hypothetical protein